jgi:hypothetical protein
MVPTMPIVCAMVSTSDNPNSDIFSAFLLIRELKYIEGSKDYSLSLIVSLISA